MRGDSELDGEKKRDFFSLSLSLPPYSLQRPLSRTRGTNTAFSSPSSRTGRARPPPWTGRARSACPRCRSLLRGRRRPPTPMMAPLLQSRPPRACPAPSRRGTRAPPSTWPCACAARGRGRTSQTHAEVMRGDEGKKETGKQRNGSISISCRGKKKKNKEEKKKFLNPLYLKQCQRSLAPQRRPHLPPPPLTSSPAS